MTTESFIRSFGAILNARSEESQSASLAPEIRIQRARVLDRAPRLLLASFAPSTELLPDSSRNAHYPGDSTTPTSFRPAAACHFQRRPRPEGDQANFSLAPPSTDAPRW